MMIATQLRDLMARMSAGAEGGGGEVPTLVWARVQPPASAHSCALEGALLLTPYAAEVLAGDAQRVGPGARIELTVPECTTKSALAGLRSQLAWLADQGVEVTVRRGPVLVPARLPEARADARDVVLHVNSEAVAAGLRGTEATALFG